MATRCCWPPDSSAGVWCSQPPRPTDCSAFGRGRVAHGGALAAVQQRQLDVLLRRGARQQVEALEHEAQVAAAQPRALVARQASTCAPWNRYCPALGVSRQPRMFIAVDLPEPLGPHDRDELAGRMSRSMPFSAISSAWPLP